MPKLTKDLPGNLGLSTSDRVLEKRGKLNKNNKNSFFKK